MINMKTNLVLIGENGELNKSIGEWLAPELGLNYLDFNDYCDYLAQAELDFDTTAEKLNALKRKFLPSLVDFCNSVIGFDGDLKIIPAIYKILKDTSYFICLSKRKAKNIVENADILIELKNKDIQQIKEEIIQKLGEL